jgi:DNA invertase Pin-like site-specific DNA recombinase
MTQQHFIGYRRSSTKHQTIGLEIQRRDIETHVERTGGEIIRWYTDVGSASATLRRLAKEQPNLHRALDDARKCKATVIAARLDRLTRSCAVLAAILESGPKLLIASAPTNTPFVLQIYAAVAEEYRRQVSRRCKAGIAAAIARGARDLDKARAAGRRFGLASRQAAIDHAEQLRPIMEGIRQGTPTSADDLARQLNERGYRTVLGGPWTSNSIFRAWSWLHRRWHSRQFPRGKGGSMRIAASGRERALHYRPLIDAYRKAGASTIADVAAQLNANDVRTPKGLTWSKANTARLLLRIKHASKS